MPKSIGRVTLVLALTLSLKPHLSSTIGRRAWIHQVAATGEVVLLGVIKDLESLTHGGG